MLPPVWLTFPSTSIAILPSILPPVWLKFPVLFIVPLLESMVPALVTPPLPMSRVAAPIFKIAPDSMMSPFIVTGLVKIGELTALGIVTLAVGPGIEAGLQFPGLLQSSSIVPVHVYIVCAPAARGSSTSKRAGIKRLYIIDGLNVALFAEKNRENNRLRA
jgi:hypothetical protein